MSTMKEQYAEALLKLGERDLGLTMSRRFHRFTRASGGFYFLGLAGALRVGRNVKTSRPASDKFKAALIASLKSPTLSEPLKRWFDNFSQSAAVDMGEGGDDKECVAETCIDVLSVHDKKLHAELRALIDRYGYPAVKSEVMKMVRTL